MDGLRTLYVAALVVTLGALTAACGSSAGAESAKAVYEACSGPEGLKEILRLDGPRVSIVVDGDAARALSGTDKEIEAMLEGGGDLDGIMVAMSVVLAQDCLVEETGYPGSAEQVKSGDEWDGWKFDEKPGAGSSFTATYTATR